VKGSLADRFRLRARASAGTRALAVAAALFYVFLWASAYVPSKIGVLDSSPLWFLVVRFAVAGGATLVLARSAGAKLPR
jgi:drug/metabolite transporter (DMT)-like permease